MTEPRPQPPVELSFPRGLVGFEALSRFRLIEDPSIAPFGRLESIDVPAIGFVVLDPGKLVHDYAIEDVRAAARVELGEDMVVDGVRLVVAFDRGRREVAVNMLAPIALDRVRGLGAQVLLHDSGLPVHHVIGEITASSPTAPAAKSNPAQSSRTSEEGTQP